MVSARDVFRLPGPRDREDSDIPDALMPYLLPTERLVVAIHQHWAIVVPPIAAAIATFFLAFWMDGHATKATEQVANVLWWVFFAVLAYAAWRVVEWRRSWFAATDKRLLLTHGFITHKVSMMPLTKVTDMSFTRTVPARILGYGLFVLESAGQDQALREINWVPRPEITYRAICSEIFGGARQDRAQVESEAAELAWTDNELSDEVHAGRAPVHEEARQRALDEELDRGLDVEELLEDWDGPDAGVRGLRETPAISPIRDGESIYNSDDRREGDTGPIRYY